MFLDRLFDIFPPRLNPNLLHFLFLKDLLELIDPLMTLFPF